MTMLRIIITSTFIALFLIGNVNTYANPATPSKLQTTPINVTFEVIIDGVKYTVPTPLNPSSVPVTVKIIQNGNIIFRDISQDTSMVVSDIIEHRVHGDSIDHGVTSQGIDHRVVGDGIDSEVNVNSIEYPRLEVSQNGIVLLNKEI